MKDNRRDFIKKGTSLAAALSLGSVAASVLETEPPLFCPGRPSPFSDVHLSVRARASASGQRLNVGAEQPAGHIQTDSRNRATPTAHHRSSLSWFIDVRRGSTAPKPIGLQERGSDVCHTAVYLNRRRAMACYGVCSTTQTSSGQLPAASALVDSSIVSAAWHWSSSLAQ